VWASGKVVGYLYRKGDADAFGRNLLFPSEIERCRKY
jgi:hypothetical protein